MSAARGRPIFPGSSGRRHSVPQIVNAILSRHNFILLGLRDRRRAEFTRATRCLIQRCLTCGLRDPRQSLYSICRRCRELVAKEETPPRSLVDARAPLRREAGYADVTIATDWRYRSHQGGPWWHELSSDSPCIMGCCRAQSWNFAINELPDLAGKIQSDSSTSCRKRRAD